MGADAEPVQQGAQTLLARQQALVDEFAELSDWEDRYRLIIDYGRSLSELPEELHSEQYRVRGCQSQVWLHASSTADGRVIYRADSDALIVKGLIAMLLYVYSGAPATEILSTPPKFVEQLGLQQHLSPSRSNGLRAMIEQMHYYARALATMHAAAVS